MRIDHETLAIGSRMDRLWAVGRTELEGAQRDGAGDAVQHHEPVQALLGLLAREAMGLQSHRSPIRRGREGHQ